MKYLFDLNLEDLPFGWDAEYKRALIETPNGSIESIPATEYDGSYQIKTYYFNPIASRELILNTFKKYQLIAQRLISQNDFPFHSDLSELIKADIVLYNCISAWVEDFVDVTYYDPKDTSDDLLNVSLSYFSQPTTEMQEFEHLKLIKLPFNDMN